MIDEKKALGKQGNNKEKSPYKDTVSDVDGGEYYGERKFKYVTFPIFLIKGMFEDPKTAISNIFCYVSYAISKKADFNYHLGATFENPESAFSTGEKLFESMPENAPQTSIQKEMLFDYYNNKKSEFEIACFLVFTALKSIIGRKPYCKTNKALIHSRMFGFRAFKEMPEHLEGMELKYSTRRRMDRIINELELNWNLKTYSRYTRGLFVSFKLTLEELAEINESQTMKYKTQELKDKKKAAFLKARMYTLKGKRTP